MNKETHETDEELNSDEVYRSTFATWGTYRSLRISAAIMHYFIQRPGEHIRQKTIIDYFKDRVSSKTTRVHLKKLVREGAIRLDPEFRGTYYFESKDRNDFSRDCDLLVRKIIDDEIYNIVKKRWLENPKEPY